MQAGKLNRRISIQCQNTEQDSFGQPLTTSWQTIYQAWASIDIQGSQLVYSTAEFMSKVACRITIRWTSSVAISAKQRIVYIDSMNNPHTYEIQAVLNDKAADKQLTIMCYELAGEE